MTAQWKSGRNALQGFRILRVGLDPDRTALYVRINGRVQKMFEAGLVEETAQLLKKYGSSARPLSSIGYKQVVQLLEGEVNHETAVAAVQQAHRNYAKRQLTWFRREPDVNRFSGFGDDKDLQQRAIALIEKSL